MGQKETNNICDLCMFVVERNCDTQKRWFFILLFHCLDNKPVVWKSRHLLCQPQHNQTFSYSRVVRRYYSNIKALKKNSKEICIRQLGRKGLCLPQRKKRAGSSLDLTNKTTCKSIFPHCLSHFYYHQK